MSGQCVTEYFYTAAGGCAGGSGLVNRPGAPRECGEGATSQAEGTKPTNGWASPLAAETHTFSTQSRTYRTGRTGRIALRNDIHGCNSFPCSPHGNGVHLKSFSLRWRPYTVKSPCIVFRVSHRSSLARPVPDARLRPIAIEITQAVRNVGGPHSRLAKLLPRGFRGVAMNKHSQ